MRRHGKVGKWEMETCNRPRKDNGASLGNGKTEKTAQSPRWLTFFCQVSVICAATKRGQKTSLSAGHCRPLKPFTVPEKGMTDLQDARAKEWEREKEREHYLLYISCCAWPLLKPVRAVKTHKETTHVSNPLSLSLTHSFSLLIALSLSLSVLSLTFTMPVQTYHIIFVVSASVKTHKATIHVITHSLSLPLSLSLSCSLSLSLLYASLRFGLGSSASILW